MLASKPFWHVYMIETVSGKLYTGITNDLGRRFKAHLEGKTGAKFFRTDAVKQIVWSEIHKDRSSASKKEAEIKKLSREAKQALVANK